MRLRFVPVLFVALQAGCLATIPPPPKLPAPSARASTATLEPCVLLSYSREQAHSEVVRGAPDEKWMLAAATILLPHESGPVLIDAAIGRATAKDMEDAPFWFQQALGDWKPARPLVELLSELGYADDEKFRVLSTHVHWDHVGALRDLPRAKAFFWEPELAFWKSRSGYVDDGVMPHQLAPLESRLASYRMDGPAYEGFPASHDVLGDGSLVAVPLPGHTPGSTAFFVNSGNGKRWLFTGDTTWSLEGIHRPAHKPFFASAIVDSDDEVLAESIALLHAFSRERPEITLVPAHDLSAIRKLPVCVNAKSDGSAL